MENTAATTIDAPPVDSTRDLHIQYWPIEKLIPYAKNARTHSERQIAEVTASIRAFGFVNPVLAGEDGVLIAGHARLAAARKLGMTLVPVIVLGYLTDHQRRELVILDNKLALNAGWNEDMLRSELNQLMAEGNLTLDLVGFSEEEMAALSIGEETTFEGNAPENDAPEPEAAVEAVTAPGDVWVLGKHRLVCGSAETLANLQTALGGGMADMVFTDPPYNVDYEGKTAKKLKIDNDALGGRFYEFLRDVCANMLAVTNGALYVCMSSSELHTLYKAFTDAGGHWSTFVIWAKHHFTLGRSDYQRMYEPILYGWREGGSHFWCGERNLGDVWQIKRPMANLEHPTMKPVELVERAIRNSSKPGAVVLDAFAGSGTTAIACQKSDRRAVMLELDPRYCDVIIRRWQKFAGGEAHNQDGIGFDALAVHAEAA
jgi:DNA modification methylase